MTYFVMLPMILIIFVHGVLFGLGPVIAQPKPQAHNTKGEIGTTKYKMKRK